jgi:hypothetical protein
MRSTVSEQILCLNKQLLELCITFYWKPKGETENHVSLDPKCNAAAPAANRPTSRLSYSTFLAACA